MSRAKKMPKAVQPQTTSQSLSSLIKTARDIMRKDKGLSTDLDRLPILTWIMFLKFLDDLEFQREEEAKLAGTKFRPAIEKPFRWRDWAGRPDGITGDALLAFINQDKCTRPDGTKGLGLFAYLRGLSSSNGDNRRDVIATVFKGVDNRMKSGYLLRDVINKVNNIHFTSSDEIYTLGHLYESMLKEMRDAAGENGEFYTPRPVVRFMVEVINPRLRETVLDPACGTGGFIAATFDHLSKQVKTVSERKVLQEKTLSGFEAKPLPYLLVQMNLLLHGLDAPQIDPGNALRFKLTEIGEKDRVDVILTNPPFGGEEEKGIQGNFPEDMQTAETALLFLQLIMRKLKRPEKNNGKPGRAAVIVPNGALYATGVATRLRRELIQHFHLHTIVRLPKGVFEPYADIPTNILFFDRGRPSKKLWFYEHPLPPHRARLKSPCYSLSDPIKFEEFSPLISWWDKRVENEHAWLEKVEDIEDDNWNLDRKNPNVDRMAGVDIPRLINELDDYSTYPRVVLQNVGTSLSALLERSSNGNTNAVYRGTLNDYCDIVKGKFPTKKTLSGNYQFVVTAADRRTANSYQMEAEAVCVPLVSSTGHGHAAIHRIHYVKGKFALANIMAAILVKPGIPLLAKYLYYYLWRFKEQKLVKLMKGTANTSLTPDKLSTVKVEFPDEGAQREIIELLDKVIEPSRELTAVAESIIDLRGRTIESALVTAFRSGKETIS